jgi:hypothetical protein
MMICPECGLEYEEGVARCEDCEVSLEREAPDPGPPGNTRFVSLLEAEDLDLFARVTSRLEERKIPWFVQSESSQGRATAVVYVVESRADEARRLMERDRPVVLRSR